MDVRNAGVGRPLLLSVRLAGHDVRELGPDDGLDGLPLVSLDGAGVGALERGEAFAQLCGNDVTVQLESSVQFKSS